MPDVENKDTGLKGSTQTQTHASHTTETANRLDPNVNRNSSAAAQYAVSHAAPSATQSSYASENHGSAVAAATAATGAAALGANAATNHEQGEKARLQDTGPASQTIGPHESNIMNVVDPRVLPDSDKQAVQTPSELTRVMPGAFPIDEPVQAKSIETETGPASKTIGPHQSNVKNVIDPTVLPDFSKQKEHRSSHSNVSQTAAESSQRSPTSTGPASKTTGPHKSNVLNVVDPTVLPDFSKQKEHHLDHSTPFQEATEPSQQEYPANTEPASKTTGPHKSNVLNVVDPTVLPDFSKRKEHQQDQSSVPHSATEPPQQTNSTDTGPASKTIGPHKSNVVNIIDPTVLPDFSKQKEHQHQPDQPTVSKTATHSSHETSYTDTGPASKTIGPHNSNTMNIVDPTVLPDPSLQRQEKPSSATEPLVSTQSNSTDTGPASKTIGPHKSNLLNILDPRVLPDFKKQAGNKAVEDKVPDNSHHHDKNGALVAGAGAGAGIAAFEHRGHHHEQPSGTATQTATANQQEDSATHKSGLFGHKHTEEKKATEKHHDKHTTVISTKDKAKHHEKHQDKRHDNNVAPTTIQQSEKHHDKHHDKHNKDHEKNHEKKTTAAALGAGTAVGVYEISKARQKEDAAPGAHAGTLAQKDDVPIGTTPGYTDQTAAPSTHQRATAIQQATTSAPQESGLVHHPEPVHHLEAAHHPEPTQQSEPAHHSESSKKEHIEKKERRHSLTSFFHRHKDRHDTETNGKHHKHIEDEPATSHASVAEAVYRGEARPKDAFYDHPDRNVPGAASKVIETGKHRNKLHKDPPAGYFDRDNNPPGTEGVVGLENKVANAPENAIGYSNSDALPIVGNNGNTGVHGDLNRHIPVTTAEQKAQLMSTPY